MGKKKKKIPRSINGVQEPSHLALVEMYNKLHVLFPKVDHDVVKLVSRCTKAQILVENRWDMQSTIDQLKQIDAPVEVTVKDELDAKDSLTLLESMFPEVSADVIAVVFEESSDLAASTDTLTSLLQLSTSDLNLTEDDLRRSCEAIVSAPRWLDPVPLSNPGIIGPDWLSPADLIARGLLIDVEPAPGPDPDYDLALAAELADQEAAPLSQEEEEDQAHMRLVARVKDMFPEYPEDQIFDVLEAHSWGVSEAVAQLVNEPANSLSSNSQRNHGRGKKVLQAGSVMGKKSPAPPPLTNAWHRGPSNRLTGAVAAASPAPRPAPANTASPNRSPAPAPAPAQVAKVALLTRLFPSVPRDILLNVLLTTNSNVGQATNLLTQLYAVPPKKQQELEPPAPPALEPPPADGLDLQQRATLRTQFLGLAARAWAAGNVKGAAAKEYSQRARHQSSLIVRQAAQPRARSHAGTDPRIDLHGLTVAEAEDVVLGLLQQYEGRADTLTVITGQGLHSANGKSRLRPAVMELLDGHGYRYTKSQGLLVVHF